MDLLFNIQPPYGMNPSAPYVINLILSPLPFKIILWVMTATTYYVTKAILRKKASYSPLRITIAASVTATLTATLFTAPRADTMLAAYAFKAYETYSAYPDSQGAFGSLHPNNQFLLKIKPLIKNTYRVATGCMDRGTALRYRQVTRFILAPLREDPASTQVIIFNATQIYDPKTGALIGPFRTQTQLIPKLKYDADRILMEENHAK